MPERVRRLLSHRIQVGLVQRRRVDRQGRQSWIGQWAFQEGFGAYEGSKRDRSFGNGLWGPTFVFWQLQFDCGVLHQRGLEVPQDQGKAVDYFTAAAEKGYVKAQHNLGMHYQDIQVFEAAVAYFRMAADQGTTKPILF